MSRTAVELACAVRAGEVRAADGVEQALARIARFDPAVHAFTTVTAKRAQEDAAAVDRTVAQGGDPGPLAGVPFAVKNLFEIAGLRTRAGSRVEGGKPPAARDAEAVRRLRAAGAILVGALNTDEYAHGFTTENTLDGPTRNPHDLDRIAGGSSGGSAAAVAAGLVPLALGSDTNGSVRVPASLCGVYGLKPTFGRVSRRGTVAFAPSLDTVGLLAGSAADVDAAYRVLRGHDPEDPVSRSDLPEPGPRQEGPLRVAVADTAFLPGASDAALAALARAASSLGAQREVTLPDPSPARAAAHLLTAAEGAQGRIRELGERHGDFHPDVAVGMLAGLLVPAAWYLAAQRFRRHYQQALLASLTDVDVLLTPATPIAATLLGQRRVVLDGQDVLVGMSLGWYTQPFSLVGLPALAVPVLGEGLPIGVQLVAAPGREDRLLWAACRLEADGVAAARVPALQG